MGHHPASTAQARAPKRHLHSARSPKGPVHAGSLRSTVLNWEDLVLKQCIPILSLRGVHTITSLDAVQADPGPCPTTQLLSLLLPYHGFLHPPSVPSPPVQASCANATPFQWSILFHWKTFGNLLLVLYSAIWQLLGILYSWVTLLRSVHWWWSAQTGNSQIKRCHLQARPQFSFNCCDLNSKETDITLKNSQQVSLSSSVIKD